MGPEHGADDSVGNYRRHRVSGLPGEPRSFRASIPPLVTDTPGFLVAFIASMPPLSPEKSIDAGHLILQFDESRPPKRNRRSHAFFRRCHVVVSTVWRVVHSGWLLQ